MTTSEEMELAVTKRREAKMLESRAKKLSDDARSVITAYYAEHPEEFVTAEDSESGKTVAWKFDEKCRITTPTKKDLPPRFDVSRTDDFRYTLEDTIGVERALYFFDISYSFNEDRWLKDQETLDLERKRQYASLILPYILPAEKGEAMTPRVEVK